MEYKNDERYWNIKLLNKWFAISSIIFMLSFIWMFYHDNDDEFKQYQREFRKIEIEVANKKLDLALASVQEERAVYEDKYKVALEDFNNKSEYIDSLNSDLDYVKGLFYKANMDYLFKKAEVDELKYLYEDEIVHSEHHGEEHESIYKDKYNSFVNDLNDLKLIKEKYELEVLDIESLIKISKTDLKEKEDALNQYLNDVNLLNNRISKLDRTKMSYLNQLGDLVRDLPILDFMDPYYKVNQVVAHDIKYDVNFASVPSVDRCTSCHLGISNPDYKDAPQPFTSHPNLDLFISSSSPHPFEQYGCTSCHSGRGRGTSFVSSVHMPGSDEQKKEWEEKYNWKKMHHWLQPMLPTKYTQAGCFKCHEADPILDGGEKLALGLMLIDKSGCNNCHHIDSYESMGKNGPPLTHLDEKLNKEWVAKWIKDPQSFRYNTWMPHFFNQHNNNDQESIERNNAEIYAITEYLYPDGDKKNFNNSSKYIGDAENGEILFKAVGCQGCHVIEGESASLTDIDVEYDMYLSKYGYEIDTSGVGIEKMDRYTLLKYQGPNLIGMGSKTDAEWIYNWIKNPEKYWPDTKMPNLRLTHEESRDITAYLLTFKNEEFDEIEPISNNSDELNNIARRWLSKSFPEVEVNDRLSKMSQTDIENYVAEKSINYYGCYTCHDIDGFEKGKPIGTELTYEGSVPVGKLDFGHIHDIGHTNYAWFEQKLANPRIFDTHKIVAHEDKSRMPNFYFKPEEIEAIVTAILGFTNNKVADSKMTYNLVEDKTVFEGYKLINQNNCQGCHVIEGFGGQIADAIGYAEFSPPNLNTQGSKTQPDWLFKFFKDPITIRPNLQVRMPSFNFTDSEWNSIIKAFQHMDERNLLIEDSFIVDINSSKFKAGAKLHEFGACNNCHFYGDVFPKQTDAKTWAPNLAMTKDRLRPDWIVKWLDNPAYIMPGTKMPAPYIPDSITLALDNAIDQWGVDIMNLGGDRNSMLESLRDYMYSIEGEKDISSIIKEYFEINGYNFEEEEEEEDFDDDW
tara:strand:- start:13449 stop:16505 length:3057 start_codon:yes stop_codon:yes gene_type:complete